MLSYRDDIISGSRCRLRHDAHIGCGYGFARRPKYSACCWLVHEVKGSKTTVRDNREVCVRDPDFLEKIYNEKGLNGRQIRCRLSPR